MTYDNPGSTQCYQLITLGISWFAALPEPRRKQT